MVPELAAYFFKSDLFVGSNDQGALLSVSEWRLLSGTLKCASISIRLETQRHFLPL